MAKKLLVILALIVVVVTVLVACGDPATTTSGKTTTGAKDPISSTPGSSSEAEATTSTEPEVEETLSVPDQFAVDQNAVWLLESHMGISMSSQTDELGVKHPYVFHFGWGASSTFGVDENDVPGLQATTGYCFYIRKHDSGEEFKRYDVGYYATQSHWECFAEAKDFVPEDGASYDVYLFIMAGENPLQFAFPETLHYWMTYPDEPWTYTAPPVVGNDYSSYMNVSETIPDFSKRLELFYHDAFTIDAEGNVRFTFKSDNNPFKNGTDTPGLSYTYNPKVFVNGVAHEVETGSYVTEQHYIINFKIANFTPVVGNEYEVIFTIDANDPTGDYCNSPDGYISKNIYTHAETPVEGEE